VRTNNTFSIDNIVLCSNASALNPTVNSIKERFAKGNTDAKLTMRIPPKPTGGKTIRLSDLKHSVMAEVG